MITLVILEINFTVSYAIIDLISSEYLLWRVEKILNIFRSAMVI